MTLSEKTKQFFQKDNPIIKGLSSTAPSTFQRYWPLLFPMMDGKTVLDIGAGRGRLSIPLKKAGADVTAIDLSLEGIRHLTEYGIWVMQGDAENLFEIPDHSVDAVFCIETLVHVPNRRKAMAEFNRVLKPEGLLIVSVTLPLNFFAWLRLRGMEFIVAPIYRFVTLHERMSRDISKKELMDYLYLAGFQPLCDFVEQSRYLMVVARKMK